MGKIKGYTDEVKLKVIKSYKRDIDNAGDSAKALLEETARISITDMAGNRMDAGIFFATELEKVSSHAYWDLTPDLTAEKVFPTDYSKVGPLAESYSYYEYERVGMMKMINNRSMDLPIVDIKKNKVTVKPDTYGNAIEYTAKDIARAAMYRLPLKADLIETSRKAWNYTVEDVAYLGSENGNAVGALYNSNINVGQLTTGAWTMLSTPSDIYKDVVQVINSVPSATLFVTKTTHVYMSPEKMQILESLIYNTTTDDTILTVLKKNFPAVTFGEIPILQGLTKRPSGLGGTTNALIAFSKSSEYFELLISQKYKLSKPIIAPRSAKLEATGELYGAVIYYGATFSVFEGA